MKSISQGGMGRGGLGIVVAKLEKFGLSMGLERLECPRKVLLTLDEWTPETGLVTAAFKIRRRFIVQKYQKEIDPSPAISLVG